MMGGGQGGGFGFSPRAIADNWRSHPGQQAFNTGAGMVLPGAGILTGAFFNWLNNHNFNNAANTSYGAGMDIGNQAEQSLWDRPLNGTLGAGGVYDGGGFGGGYGGLLGQVGGTPTSDGAAQPWYENTTMNAADPLGLVPDYDPSSQVPGSPGMHMNPQARRDYRDSLAMNGVGTPANYGVSNFMVGGSPVIFGTGDPNGRYRNRGYEYGG